MKGHSSFSTFLQPPQTVHSKWMLEVWLSGHSHFISKYVITNEKTKARMFVLLKQKLGVKHEMVGEI